MPAHSKEMLSLSSASAEPPAPSEKQPPYNKTPKAKKVFQACVGFSGGFLFVGLVLLSFDVI